VEIPKRWLTSKQAAEYCTMSDHKYFLKIVKIYNIPRYGPSGRAFDLHDLDRWMVDKKCFSPDHAHSYRRRPGSFTPIHHFLTDQANGIEDEEDQPDKVLPTNDELREMLALRRKQGVVRL